MKSVRMRWKFIWADANEDLFDLTVKIDGWVLRSLLHWDERKEIWISNSDLITLCICVCMCVLHVFRGAESGHIENMEYTLAKLLSRVTFIQKPQRISLCNIYPSPPPPSYNKADNNITASETPLRSSLKIWTLNAGISKDFSAPFLGSTKGVNIKRPMYIYIIIFSEFLLIKVDRYTCWIKRNIMKMYFCCIIYLDWPGRVTLPWGNTSPDTLCQTNLWLTGEFFALEFYKAFICCYITLMFQVWGSLFIFCLF